MNRIIHLSFLANLVLVVFVTFANINNKDFVDNQDELTIEQKIKKIRQVYYGIQNNLKSYTEKTEMICLDSQKPWTCSNYTVFFDSNNRIVKLVNSAGEEGVGGTTEHFFENGKLFFVYEVSEDYRTDPVEVEQQRIYVYDDEIIRVLYRSGNENDINGKESKEMPLDNIDYFVKNAYQYVKTFKENEKD